MIYFTYTNVEKETSDQDKITSKASIFLNIWRDIENRFADSW